MQESSSLEKPSHKAHASFPHSKSSEQSFWNTLDIQFPLYEEKIKDAPKRTEIPGTVLCGSFKVAAGAVPSRGGAGKGKRVAVALGSGSNYRTVSILSHLTAAWNTHHSSHHSPTDQINSRADKGRAQQQAQWPEAPSLISCTPKEWLLFLLLRVLSLGLYLCSSSLMRQNLKDLRPDPQTSQSHAETKC